MSKEVPQKRMKVIRNRHIINHVETEEISTM